MNTNPYSAPTSSVDTPTDPGKFQLHDPRTVSVGHGIEWISDGFGHFGKDPGVWIPITIAYFGISFIPTIVSFANDILGTLLSLAMFFLTFVWIGGLMLGCRAQDSGEGLKISHLFAGFKVRAGSLLLLSVVFFVLMFVVLIIVVITMAGQFASMGITDPEQISPALLTANLMTMLLPILVILLFLIPIAMLIWFAPALIVLNDIAFFDALGLSFKGCLKNMLPFLIYGLVFLIVGIVAFVIIAIGMALVGYAAFVLYFAFVLVVFPIAQGSIYRSYKDIYINH